MKANATWGVLGVLAFVGCSSFGTTGDSSSNAADAGTTTGAGSSPCRGGSHAVCEDFDHGAVAASLSLSVGDGTADVVSDVSVSAPGAIRMTMGSGYPSPSLAAPLSNLHSVRCSFSARLEDNDTRDLTILTLGTADADEYVKLLVVADSSMKFGEYSAANNVASGTDLKGTLRKGAWVRVVVEIHGGAKPTFAITVNGITDQGALSVPDFASGYTSVELEAWPGETNGPGRWSIAYDDLVCDAL